jgi:hypothetical protein
MAETNKRLEDAEGRFVSAAIPEELGFISGRYFTNTVELDHCMEVRDTMEAECLRAHQ